MSDENTQVEDNKPAIDESRIQELALAKAEQIAAERYKGWESPEDVAGLKRKRDELLAKEAKYKGISEEDIDRFKADQEKRSKDEIYALLSDGKHDEAIRKLTEPRYEAWNEQLSETKVQFDAAQKRIEELEQMEASYKQKLTEVTKRQYLKDLVSEDDSFRMDYFSDFLELQGSKMEVDPETGIVYALENGKRKVDVKGDFVKFDQHYAKLKVEHGLFWKGGTGTNTRGSQGGDLGKPFNKMTNAEKSELRKQIGDDEYRQLVLKNSKK